MNKGWASVLLLLMGGLFAGTAKAANDIAPDAWISVQTGTFTGHSITTDGKDVSQSQFGGRLVFEAPENMWDVRYDVGVLKSEAGYFLDTEFDAIGSIRSGNAVLHPLMVVGMPIGLMGDPYHFAGFDVTFGGGMIAEVPVGNVWLEGRGQAAFNFLSYLAKLNGDPYDANNTVHAHDAMLLYRVSAAAWFPMGRQRLRVELRRDDFHNFHTNAIGFGLSM